METQSDGATLRQHLEGVEKQTGKRPHELDGPEFPKGAEYLWEWYWQLRRRCGGNGFGPSPIPHAEIDAWVRLTGTDPAPWELEVLGDIDIAYLKQAAEAQRRKDGKSKGSSGNS